MQKYTTLIFDLDDTLIDNCQSIKYAFKIMINELGISFSEDLFKKWQKFDTEYWHTWESGSMDKPNTIITLDEKITYLRANRFINFFNNLAVDFAKVVKLNEIYCCMLGENIIEIPNARKLLQELKLNYEIIIATNGPRGAAINKVMKAKLDNYISFIVSSEEVGFSKPMPQFFDFMFNKIENKDKSKMLLIGDSLTTDVLGGMKNGLDTCWFNPNNLPIKEKYMPTITINNLLQLKKKL